RAAARFQSTFRGRWTLKLSMNYSRRHSPACEPKNASACQHSDGSLQRGEFAGKVQPASNRVSTPRKQETKNFVLRPRARPSKTFLQPSLNYITLPCGETEIIHGR